MNHDQPCGCSMDPLIPSSLTPSKAVQPAVAPVIGGVAGYLVAGPLGALAGGAAGVLLSSAVSSVLFGSAGGGALSGGPKANAAAGDMGVSAAEAAAFQAARGGRVGPSTSQGAAILDSIDRNALSKANAQAKGLTVS